MDDTRSVYYCDTQLTQYLIKYYILTSTEEKVNLKVFDYTKYNIIEKALSTISCKLLTKLFCFTDFSLKYIFLYSIGAFIWK